MSDVVALLIGHGSSHSSQKEVIVKLADIIKEKRVFADVYYAFMRVNDPPLRRVLRDIVKRGYRRVVAIPVFVSEGVHTAKDIPDALGIPRGSSHHKALVDGVEVDVYYAKPLGVDERIAEVIITRGLEALTENS